MHQRSIAGVTYSFGRAAQRKGAPSLVPLPFGCAAVRNGVLLMQGKRFGRMERLTEERASGRTNWHRYRAPGISFVTESSAGHDGTGPVYARPVCQRIRYRHSLARYAESNRRVDFGGNVRAGDVDRMGLGRYALCSNGDSSAFYWTWSWCRARTFVQQTHYQV